MDMEEQTGETPHWAWNRYSTVTDTTKLDLDAAREERKVGRKLPRCHLTPPWVSLTVELSPV